VGKVGKGGGEEVLETRAKRKKEKEEEAEARRTFALALTVDPAAFVDAIVVGIVETD